MIKVRYNIIIYYLYVIKNDLKEVLFKSILHIDLVDFFLLESSMKSNVVYRCLNLMQISYA